MTELLLSYRAKNLFTSCGDATAATGRTHSSLYPRPAEGSLNRQPSISLPFPAYNMLWSLSFSFPPMNFSLNGMNGTQ